MNKNLLSSSIIGEYNIEIRLPGFGSTLEVCIWRIDFPRIVFEVTTRFKKTIPATVTFECKLVDNLILVFASDEEIKTRICRFPIEFIEEIIAECNDIAVKPLGVKDWYYQISVNDINSTISTSFQRKLSSSSFGKYHEQSEFKNLAAWITFLDYETIPSYHKAAPALINEIVKEHELLVNKKFF